jgi:hypothetical protein
MGTMGTRHVQTVISKEGDVKIQQYGQWDGYPEHQGVEILNYLRNGDLKKYQKNLSKIPLINKKQSKRLSQDPNWALNYPYMSRDCGASIHKMIENGEVKFVSHIDEKEAGDYCEGFYTIDFSKNEFISEYHGEPCIFKLDDLPSDEIYLNKLERK